MGVPGVQVDLSDCITSCTRITLSMILRPSTLLDCSLEMMKGSTSLSHRAITFVMVL